MRQPSAHKGKFAVLLKWTNLLWLTFWVCELVQTPHSKHSLSNCHIFYVEKYQEVHMSLGPVVHATVDNIPHVISEFYLLYKPENQTIQVEYIEYNRCIKEIWVYFCHCVHSSVGTYRKRRDLFRTNQVLELPQVGCHLRRTDLWTQQEKIIWVKGWKNSFQVYEASSSVYDYTLLQRTGIKSTHITLRLCKPQTGCGSSTLVLLLVPQYLPFFFTPPVSLYLSLCLLKSVSLWRQ